MTQPQKSKSKKICLLGASGVGKTSLVKRFVEGKFVENYRTTIGFHMYAKCVTCDEERAELIIWDLEGKDDPRSEYPAMHLKGAQGYMLVADVTRLDTLDVAKGLLSTIVGHRPPSVLLLNKMDLLEEDPAQLRSVTERVQISFGDAVNLFKTSAKLGEHVDQAFNCLVKQMLEVDRRKSS
jgi:small GTP-binding protein